MQELVKRKAEIDATNKEEQTPLHLAAKHGNTKVVKELVKNNDKLVSHKDEDERTPLHLAASNGHSMTALALIEAKANVAAKNRAFWTPLHCAADKGNSEVVKVLLEAGAPLDTSDRNKETPLMVACSRGHVSVVNMLIQKGANVALKDRKDMNCLDLAIKKGHQDVALALMNSSQWKITLQNATPNPKEGYRDTPMRKLIRTMPDVIDVDVIDVDVIDVDVIDVAHVAFNNCTKATNGNNPDDDDYEIFFNYEFLDDAYVYWPDEGDSESTRARNSPLLPYSTHSSILKGNHPLMIMVEHHQEALLAHPLVTSLLQYKWDNFGRYVYYTNLASYVIFLTFLTVYVMESTAPYMYNSTATNFNITENGDFCINVKNWYQNNKTGHDIKLPLVAVISKYIVMVLAVLNLVREILQLRTQKFNYFGFENTIELTSYLGSILLVTDFSICQQETGIRMGWQWQVGAVALFVAWMDLLLFIRKIPRFGIYIVMFTDILQTFLQFSLVFFLFVVAFALAFFMLMQNQVSYDFALAFFMLMQNQVSYDFDLAFYMLMQNQVSYDFALAFFMLMQNQVSYDFALAFFMLMQNQVSYDFALAFFMCSCKTTRRMPGEMFQTNQYAFSRPEFSLLKTSVMMTGEFDFDNVFYWMGSYDPSDSASDVHKKTVYYSAMSYALFVVFLVLMAILVTNLLVGLAVDDIKAVQEKASLQRLAMQVQLALDVESIIPQYFRRRCVIESRKLRPNTNAQHRTTILWLTTGSDLSSDTITKALSPQMNEIQQLQENMEKLTTETIELKAMITAICENQNIKCSRSDYSAINRD
ncbi:Transient receptor potential cation channel subfamily A member basal [Lamellibrachia satsuma]|nr:Transient receptor potential cation channel subfamily A member basal [Lamellibrachia satsuma]